MNASHFLDNHALQMHFLSNFYPTIPYKTNIILTFNRLIAKKHNLHVTLLLSHFCSEMMNWANPVPYGYISYDTVL